MEGGRGFDEDAGRDVGDEEHRNGKGEDGFEDAAEGFVGHAGNVEEVVVAPDDALGANGPEADGGEEEHQGVVDDNADDAEDEEAKDLEEVRQRAYFAGNVSHVQGVGHGREGEGAVDKCAEVDLAE